MVGKFNLAPKNKKPVEPPKPVLEKPEPVTAPKAEASAPKTKSKVAKPKKISPPNVEVDAEKWLGQEDAKVPVAQHKTSLECDKDLFLRVKSKASLHNTNIATIYREAMEAFDKTHGFE